ISSARKKSGVTNRRLATWFARRSSIAPSIPTGKMPARMSPIGNQDGVAGHFDERREPERDHAKRAGRLAPANREERAHLAAVLVPERGGIQPENTVVHAHIRRALARGRRRAPSGPGRPAAAFRPSRLPYRAV